MIAGHRKVEPFGLGILPPFNLAHPPPVNARRIIVLLVASHDAALTPYATAHIEVKTVLFPRLEGLGRDERFGGRHAAACTLFYRSIETLLVDPLFQREFSIF